MATPKQTDPQFKLRFTPELRDQIEAAAKANTRTMNSEIIARLEDSFTFPQKEYRLRAEITEMNQVTDSLHQEISDLQDQIKRQKEREIENLAEIKRLRTDRQGFDREMDKRQKEIDNLREEIGEVRQILRNYVAHSEYLSAIADQLRVLRERLPDPKKDNA